MSARSLFELSVETKLIDAIPDAITKMVHFVRLEKLRAARKYVAFCEAHPTRKYPSDPAVYQSFISANAASIEAFATTLWPTLKLGNVKHWSGLNLAERVKKLDASYQEAYDCFYPLLSWYVHAGLTGVLNLKAEAFAHLSGISYQLATIAYGDIIMRVAREFKLSTTNPDLDKKLELARYLPLTENEEQELQLHRELGLL